MTPVKIAVTGSIATDHLMTFAGRFSDSLIDGELHSLSLSFLVDNLAIFRGGVAGNICFGLAQFGLNPVLVGAVGPDFDDYRAWLERHGVDTESVHVVDELHTARFICTTDVEANQIASFYAGAMSLAGQIELEPVVARVGPVDMFVVAPNDPRAMHRHTEECRARGYQFAADPSQQLAYLDGPAIRDLIDGAAYLFTNEYEAALTEKKTGWSADEILARVGTRVTTLGPRGARVERQGEAVIEVACVTGVDVVDPTGLGDSFRAGFLAGLARDLDLERCAQVGSLIAVEVLSTKGTQEYSLDQDRFLARARQHYGGSVAADLAVVFG